MTIPQIILRAEISEYLAVLGIKKGGLYGGGTPSHLPSLIYQVRKSVSRVYDLDPTNEYLVGNANYLFALCGGFGIRASYLINSGGSIPSTSGVTLYGHPVSGTYTATVDGETVLDLGLPSGALVYWAQKSIQTLVQNTEWVYASPNLTLLNGISLSASEPLNYMYVLPI